MESEKFHIDASDLRASLESVVKDKLSGLWNNTFRLEGQIAELLQELKKERARSTGLCDELAAVEIKLKKTRRALRAKSKSKPKRRKVRRHG